MIKATLPKARQMRSANSGDPLPPELFPEVLVAAGVALGWLVTPRTPCEPEELAVGDAVAVAVGVAVGVGSGVGDGVDVGVTVGVGSGDGVTVGEGLGIGLGIRRLKACLRWRGACLSEARCTGVAGSMSERSAIWSTALLST